MSEKFSLKWKDFHSNVSKSFSLFRNEEYLHDVTLVSDDHKQISAHKLVLSACSDYFNDIFKNSKHSHLMLCLDGVNNQDLNNILDYIYNGEVQIYQDDLDRFLTVAQRFQLNGLIGNNTSEESKEEVHEEEPILNKSDLNPIKPTSSNPVRKVQTVSKVLDENCIKEDIRTISVTEEEVQNVKEKVNEFMEKCSDGSYRCTVCGKTSSHRNASQNMRNHIQTHLEGLSLSCPLCQKTFRSAHSLQVHQSKYHKS